MSLGDEREEGQGLAGGPVELVLLDGFDSFINVELFYSLMDGEIGWEEATRLSIFF